LGGHHHHHHHDDGKNDTQPVSNDESVDAGAAASHTPKTQTHAHKTHTHSAAEDVRAGCPCCADDPAGDLEGLHQMAAQIHDYETREKREWEGQAAQSENGSERSAQGGGQDVALEQAGTTTTTSPPEDDRENDDDAGPGQEENDKLMRMSINTAIAIGLHNFPEGLATFVAALNDPRVGGVLAIAIAIHNIPEGLCVAMPIYYATGNRWKAFGWAVLSGASEPLAALLGWAVLANSFSDDMYAILFGLVAGMMVIISVRELLPTAHRYDPDDTVVTYSFMIGMAIMALSLVLFTL
jgi:ZIP family zinc transporter